VIKELEAQIEALTAKVLKLTQQVYGRKSEQQATKAKNVQSGGRRGQQEGAKGHGRRESITSNTIIMIA
jgi:hypothetical protein